MTATATEMDARFEEGAQAARAKFGEECRKIDETLHGLQAVLAAGGQQHEVMDLWNRYQYPVMLYCEGKGMDAVLPAMLAAAGELIKKYTKILDSISRDWNYLIRHAWDQVKLWAFRRQVLQLIEADLKTHQPGLRKNSKEYKRLQQMVFCEAQKVILARMSEELSRQIGMLNLHLDSNQIGTVAEEAEKQRQSCRYLRSVADDLKILEPACSLVEDLRILAQRHLDHANMLMIPILQALVEMKKASETIDLMLPALDTADVLRRSWYRTLKEVDDRGLKGPARRDREVEAMRHLAVAEQHQIDIDNVLRSENMLKEEEKMTCEK